jgi:predicted SnoaL-like aldol condensation-catalyzing enzyme
MNKKEIAKDFLTLCAKGESRQAFELYATKNLRHHNPYFKGDADSLMIAMEDEGKRNPTKIFDIHRAIEDGDLVAVHSHIRENAQDQGLAVVHILRFEADKVVEFWDIAQAVPEEKINENEMF